MLKRDNGRQDNEEHAVLLDLFRRGDTGAFTHIYQHYHRMLYVLAHRYLKDKESAEDAVQHVFIKLWESRRAILVSINLRNYLYTMMKNHILNQVRSNNTAVSHNYQLVQTNGIYEDNLLETIERKELMDAFYKALELLPEQKRMVCRLKMDGKLSNFEIADRMQISVNTVKTHYAQAIKLLRGYLQRMLFFIIAITLL